MSEIRVDTISEKTSANGVAVDGVTLKDGGIAATAGSTITVTDNSDALTLKTTDADSNVGPVLNFNRDSASPADNDFLGAIDFQGDNDAGETHDYIRILSRALDVSNGAEKADLVIKDATGTNIVNMTHTEVVYNDDSIDRDFRVESNGNTHMLFVDGGDNRVGINESSPTTQLQITGASGAGGTLSLKRPDTAVTAGQTLGGIEFITADSGSAGIAARILGEADGTGGEGKIVFATGTGGSTSTAWTITSGGDLLPGATDHGIHLGVTSAADSNLLDDYEEGVTGDITINSNSGSVALASGFRQLAYTKVGRVVHVTGLLKPTTSDASGGINFALPFALADISDRSEICRGFGYVVNAANSNSAGGGLILEVQTAGSTTCAIIKTTNTANGLTDMNTTYIAASGTELSVDFSYIAA